MVSQLVMICRSFSLTSCLWLASFFPERWKLFGWKITSTEVVVVSQERALQYTVFAEELTTSHKIVRDEAKFAHMYSVTSLKFELVLFLLLLYCRPCLSCVWHEINKHSLFWNKGQNLFFRWSSPIFSCGMWWSKPVFTKRTAVRNFFPVEIWISAKACRQIFAQICWMPVSMHLSHANNEVFIISSRTPNQTPIPPLNCPGISFRKLNPWTSTVYECIATHIICKPPSWHTGPGWLKYQPTFFTSSFPTIPTTKFPR